MPITNNQNPDLSKPEAENEMKNVKNELTEKAINNEFAEKKPLFTMKTIIKMGLGLITIFILGTVIVIILALIKKKPKQIEPPKEPDIPVVIEKPVTSDLPKLAYIKNQNTVWETNIKGESKALLVNIGQNTNQIITSLDWKTKDKISYSQCTKDSTGCKINVYSKDNKSQETVLTEPKATLILKHAWSPDKRTLGYIEQRGGNTYLNLKSGNVLTPLESFPATKDIANTKTRLLFTPDGEYVIFYAEKKDIITDQKYKSKKESASYPVIMVYRLNGIKVDEIKNASDPFLIDKNLLGYNKDNQLKYKEIGSSTETLITNQTGLNPVISPNKKLIAYWAKETGGLKKIVLQIFDTELNIRRDILRGIVLPTWLTDHSIAGIKLDSCLTENCLLYEFQTAGLVIVDTNTSKTTVVDQGDSISAVTLNTNAD